MRYYNKAKNTELFDDNRVPPQLRYNPANSNHIALPDDNPFFSPLPEGYELAYDPYGVPEALAPIPDYALNKAKGGKVGEIYEFFQQLALDDGIRTDLDTVWEDYQMRGKPQGVALTPAREALYDNAIRAMSAIATVEGYTTVLEVNQFDVSTPSGTGYSGGTWDV